MTRATELPFIIKVCGITNDRDARVALAAGANALGFNFYEKSPRHISTTRAKEIINAVSGYYVKVGIFVNPTEGEVLAAVESLGLDVVQLHGDQCPVLSALSVWKALAADHEESSYPAADAYLLDSATDTFGGSGKVFDWGLAAHRNIRVLIAGGLDGANVAEAIASTVPWGVDACSRLESRPGKKDAQKVTDFVRAAQQAFRTHMRQEISI